MKRELQTTDKTEFDTIFLQALTNEGATFENDFELPESGNILQHLEVIETDEEGNEYTRKQILNVDFVRVYPKIKDLDGNFIPETLDEEGNPTSYKLESGYHVNIAANIDIEFPAEVIVTPTLPQFNWA